ncbi:hypothetical protein ELI00_23035 [Rhizobium ruizarguesonis]|uniref:hypothetical protein n=1 Tax=Rhizobium ruizarguesonis TaxID=2081791 RepID=UPI00103102F6|nr:hypothetical protein [Rhizobium ruizarguesonis]TAX78896.1 hypothetical protein ELI00_23035 [Rhizobium ruizarguesonis]
MSKRFRQGRTWQAQLGSIEHDAEKRERFSDDIMLYFFDLDPDSDFGPVWPKIIRIWHCRSFSY